VRPAPQALLVAGPDGPAHSLVLLVAQDDDAGVLQTLDDPTGVLRAAVIDTDDGPHPGGDASDDARDVAGDLEAGNDHRHVSRPQLPPVPHRRPPCALALVLSFLGCRACRP